MSKDQDVLNEIRAIVQRGEGEIIIDGRLLPERALVEYYNVGRREIRNALTELEQDGLLYRKQGMGTFISTTAPKATRVSSLTRTTSPQEIMEVREVIEPSLARLAAMRATINEIEQMKEYTLRGQAAQTPQQYERWDNAFHVKIAQSARNELFLKVFELINGVRAEQNWIHARRASYSPHRSGDVQKQHLQIIEAIENRDPQAAEASMLAHIRIATQTLFQGGSGKLPRADSLDADS